MKTRIIKTSFSKSMIRKKAPYHARNIYRYLLTCEHINISGEFELSDEQIQLETGISSKDLETAKKWLQDNLLVLFCEGYIKVVKALEHNGYLKSEDNIKAYEKERENISPSIRACFNNLTDSSVNSTVGTPPTVTRNKKQEIEIGLLGKEIEIECRSFLKVWNELFSTRYTSTDAVLDNYTYWRKQYSFEQIKLAVEKAKTHAYWKDKIDPEKLLRQRNPNKERVNRIEEFLNYAVKSSDPYHGYKKV